jgi:hypothetical protein
MHPFEMLFTHFIFCILTFCCGSLLYINHLIFGGNLLKPKCMIMTTILFLNAEIPVYSCDKISKVKITQLFDVIPLSVSRYACTL